MARSLASLLALALVLPPATARAQDPVTTPPPPPPAESTPSEPATAPADSFEPPPPATAAAAEPSSGDEYDTLRRTLPNDYDINFTFSGGDRKRKRDNDPGRAAKSASRMGVAGGTLVLLGMVGALTTVTAGLVIAKKADDDLKQLTSNEQLNPGMTPDYDKRVELLKKGENGDRTAIIGGAISGAALAVGVGLLLGARSMRKRTYGADAAPVPSSSGGRPPLSSKARTNLAIYGTVLALYGVIGIGAGAVLIRNDDDKKKRNGIILLASGAVLGAISIPMFAVLLIDKRRRGTARMNFAPTFVRRGGGAQLSLRF